MVTNVTSFSRSGLSDFVVQRVTAVVLALYAISVVAFFVMTPTVTYATLVGFFGSEVMQIFSTLALLATVAHAWIGMWTIGTDYVREHYFGGAATFCRLVYQAGCLLTLFLYTIWGLRIFWSL